MADISLFPRENETVEAEINFVSDDDFAITISVSQDYVTRDRVTVFVKHEQIVKMLGKMMSTLGEAVTNSNA
jgi:hypothetical protein